MKNSIAIGIINSNDRELIKLHIINNYGCNTTIQIQPVQFENIRECVEMIIKFGSYHNFKLNNSNVFLLDINSKSFDYLELKRIECSAFVNNNQSNRVCEKLNLEYEGIRKKGYMLYDGSIHDIVCYSITDDEFYNRIRKNIW